jgi:mono/diheme cytochrome c family protein
VGSYAAGQVKYVASCGTCHAAGTFDTSTAAGGNNLKGRQARLVANLGTISSFMTGLTLTPQEILDLEVFLRDVP